MRRSILLAAVLLLSTASIYAEDTCRNEFVACVQKSGNPGQCQSVFANCKSSAGQDVVSRDTSSASDTGALQFWTELVQYEGNFTAVRLLVSNPSNDLVQLRNAEYQVLCVDGTTEKAIFVMTGQVAGNTKRKVAGADQFVCMTAGGPDKVEEHINTLSIEDGMMSYQHKLDLEVPCAENQNQFITVTYQKNRAFHWKNSAGVKGVLTRKIVEREDFAQLACESNRALSPALITTMKKQVLRLLNWMFSEEKPQSQVIFVNDKSTALGVRD